MSTGHLTDEQIFAAVLGEEAPMEHLRLCDVCHRQEEEMQANIGAFRSAADAWSGSLPAAPHTPQEQARRWPRFTLATAVSAAVVVAGVIAIGTVAPRLPPGKSPASVADSAEQIGADNALLQNVELALDSQPSVSVPMTEQSSREPHSTERRN